ncbi:MAG: hypothetical protein WA628_05190 [Terriglobales bacterium]
MKPLRERSSHLDITEVVIPFELRDAGDPQAAEGKWRHNPERSHDRGAYAG